MAHELDPENADSGRGATRIGKVWNAWPQRWLSNSVWPVQGVEEETEHGT